LWEIDVPAIVDHEPAIPQNYWIRGILGELAIYKRLYKNAGYEHFPTATAFDLKSAAEYVQTKTLKNPDGAISAMRKAWLEELPPMPTALEVAPTLLSPDRNYPAAARLYYDPTVQGTYFHPDARSELRSIRTLNLHGHQICFTASGNLIPSGVSAGSADKQAPFHFPDYMQIQPHVDADVTPFVWSLQLDGNPCIQTMTTLSKPMLHQGANIDMYFECRPAVPNDKPRFLPGSTP
jgi:hypothetical protein